MKLTKKDLSGVPVLALLAANAVPLFGVVFLGWDAFYVVMLYWAENVVIGFYNVLKIALAAAPHPAAHAGKLFLIPFFMVHYGGFTAVHGFFVLGSDADDIDTIERTIRFCRNTKLDSVQFSILFPIPGTKLFEQLSSQGRIFTKDWSLYDGTHVVFEPKKLSAFELQNKVLRAWKKFYTVGRFKLFLMSRYLIRSWKKANKKFLRQVVQKSPKFLSQTTDFFT